MQSRTLLAVATASTIAFAAAYLLWGRRQRVKQDPSGETAAPSARAGVSVVAEVDAGLALAVGGAVIEGEVQFTGTPPVPAKLHREADPYCARREMTDPTVLVASGKLANVWVHVIKGAPDVAPPATAPVVTQRNSM